MVPICEEAVGQTYINGIKLTSMKPVELSANDRIIFGQGAAFLFRNQDNASKSKVQDTPENPVTIEFAMKEKQDNED